MIEGQELKTLSEIKQVAIVGAGLMGHGIAQSFAQKGYPVTLYDIHSSILERAFFHIRSNLETFVEVGLEEAKNVEKILSQIRASSNLQEAVKDAHLVIEAAPEDLKLKMDLFEAFDRYCFREAILASNTSTLPISEIGKNVKGKERLVITHWFNPPHIVPVVEVVPGEKTSTEVFEMTLRLLRRIGKKPIKILKEIPGFLINRIQTAMFREMLSLLEQGVAFPEDIDEAVKGSFGFRLAVMGPLQTIDMGGLDLIQKGMKYLYPLIDRSADVPKILREKVERGDLGLKTGKGFFQYGEEKGLALSRHSKERDKKLLYLLKALSE